MNAETPTFAAPDLAVVLLAAGMGTRMNSKKQKILHPVAGRPMVMHVVEAARAVAPNRPVLVIGELGGEALRDLVGDRADYVVQPEQLGTGHAARMAAGRLRGRSRQVLVTYGDMPLLQASTMAHLAARQAETGAAVVLLTVLGESTSTFGRIVRGGDGQVCEIVEVAQARQRPNGADLLAIPELNVGVYCFDGDWLWENLERLPPRQARGGETEFYLTDLVEMAVAQGRRVEAHQTDDPDEGVGAGTRAELAAVEAAFQRRINGRWLAAGVTLVDPGSIFIDATVEIGRDTVIWPGSFLQGTTVVGEDCVIGPNAIVRDSRLGRGARVEMAVIEGADIGEGVVVPPLSHIRRD